MDLVDFGTRQTGNATIGIGVFFFGETGGVPYWLYIKLVKKNSYYNPELRDKKGNKENQRNYK